MIAKSVRLKKTEDGTFGDISNGLWKGIMKVAIISCKMEPTRFLRQAELLKILKHRNIVQLHGVCKEPLYIYGY